MRGRPDVESPAQRQCERRQAFSHASDSICAIGVVPIEGLQYHVGSGKGDAEMLGVHDHKVPEELLHLQFTTHIKVTSLKHGTIGFRPAGQMAYIAG